MLFHVGPWVYRVEIARTLVNAQNEPIMGRCDLDGMIIYVAADVSPQARLNVVLHELHPPHTRHHLQQNNLIALVRKVTPRYYCPHLDAFASRKSSQCPLSGHRAKAVYDI